MQTSKASNNKTSKKKGLYEFSIFCIAIATGTACSIVSKVMYDLHGMGLNGEIQRFNKPFIQTLAMFAAMVFGLPLHWLVVHFNIPFPAYGRFLDEMSPPFTPRSPRSPKSPINTIPTSIVVEERTPFVAAAFGNDSNYYSTGINIQYPVKTEEDKDSIPRIPIKTYFYLAIPAVFDLAATSLCMCGLLFLDVSIYQLLRGSGIIFVALIRQSVLKEALYGFQWVGVSLNVLSVLLVGTAAVLNSNQAEDSEPFWAIVGVAFMLAGTLVQAMQFVFEEKVMVQDENSVPPLFLFGMEGVWGTILSLIILYPIGYYLPGKDEGSFENFWNTWHMLMSNPEIQFFMSLYLLAIIGYNLFALLVTFSLSSIWHSILDNFRPMTVWITDLFIFYIVATGGSFGEPWTKFSWLQLVGMLVLIYGTAIYNAPDVGSICLTGEWYSFGLDFDKEYREIQAQQRFAMGSYPSLQKFAISSSLRVHMKRSKSETQRVSLASLFDDHSV